METLLLGQDDVERLLDPLEALPALRSAFQAYSVNRGIPGQRARSDLQGPGTATVLFPGTVGGIPAYSVKVHAKFPARFPAIRGVLLLHTAENGDLLAVMDSTYLTAVRTGLVSALATDLLARQRARKAAVIGAGTQGEFQLRFVHQLRELTSVRLFDTDGGKAALFAARMGPELQMPVHVTSSVAEAVLDADIILAATRSREPFLHPGMVSEGAHISTLGADEPGKCEVAAELIVNSVFICDDRELALDMGAIAGAGLGVEAISAELGEVIAGLHPGRQSETEATIFGSVGLPFQDLVIGWQVYQGAISQGLGIPFSFLRG